MDWKEYYTPWWEKINIEEHYDDFIKHPDFAGCSPTPDVDVVWFKIREDKTKYVFSLKLGLLAIEKTYIKYEYYNNSLIISLGKEKVDKEKNDDLDEFYDYGRCSVYYTNPEGKNNHFEVPLLTFQFSYFEGFNTHLNLKVLPEQSYLGLYMGAW